MNIGDPISLKVQNARGEVYDQKFLFCGEWKEDDDLFYILKVPKVNDKIYFVSTVSGDQYYSTLH